MMDEVMKMQETIVGIKDKIKIATTPDHPLLKTWNGNAVVACNRRQVNVVLWFVASVALKKKGVENVVNGKRRSTRTKSSVSDELL